MLRHRIYNGLCKVNTSTGMQRHYTYLQRPSIEGRAALVSTRRDFVVGSKRNATTLRCRNLFYDEGGCQGISPNDPDSEESLR